jgi:hypothetical protein
VSIKPSITRGLGALTPSAWKDIVGAIDAINEFKPQYVSQADGGDRKMFYAKITGATQPDATIRRWAYAWTQVRRDSDAYSFTTVSSGMTSTTNGGKPAINTLEAGNTSSLAYGIAVDASGNLTTAEGWVFNRVPDNCVLEMYVVRDSNGKTSFQFTAPNPITGECPAPPAPVLSASDYGSFLEPSSTAVPYDAETFSAPNTEIFDFEAF